MRSRIIVLLLLCVSLLKGEVASYEGDDTSNTSLKSTTMAKPGDENRTKTSLEDHKRLCQEKWRYLVAVDDGKQVQYTGALITMSKVVTTCGAVRSSKIRYATGDFGCPNPIIRAVKKAISDPRCRECEGLLDCWRYNVGIVEVERPFEFESMEILQLPTRNKLIFLQLVDQLISRQLECTVIYRDSHGKLESVKIEMVPSHSATSCRQFHGLHEFVCSLSGTTNISKIVQGAPIICGEDAFGIMSLPRWQIDKNSTKNVIWFEANEPLTPGEVHIWMRFDEFIHLFVNEG